MQGSANPRIRTCKYKDSMFLVQNWLACEFKYANLHFCKSSVSWDSLESQGFEICESINLDLHGFVKLRIHDLIRFAKVQIQSNANHISAVPKKRSAYSILKRRPSSLFLSFWCRFVLFLNWKLFLLLFSLCTNFWKFVVVERFVFPLCILRFYFLFFGFTVFVWKRGRYFWMPLFFFFKPLINYLLLELHYSLTCYFDLPTPKGICY